MNIKNNVKNFLFSIFLIGLVLSMPLATATSIEEANAISTSQIAIQQRSFQIGLHDSYDIPGSNFRVQLNNIAYEGNDPNPRIDFTVCTLNQNVNSCAVYTHMKLYSTITSNEDSNTVLKLTPSTLFQTGMVEFTYYLSKNIINVNTAPVIDEVSGPQNLAVNENGIWKISAHDDGQNLRYKVDWGDRPKVIFNVGSSKAMAESIAIQDSTFSHTYTNSGKYTVRFTVIDEKGLTAESTITVRVDNAIVPISNPDLAISDVEFNNPIYVGDTVDFTIRLKNYGNADASYYSINYEFGDGSGTGMATGSYQTIKPGDVVTLHTAHTYNSIGQYTFKVSVKTDNELNMNNNVASKLVDVRPKLILPVINEPVIESVGGPQKLNVNEQGTWSLSVQDNGQNLRYMVDWGDRPQYIGVSSDAATNIAMVTQDSTFTHSYSNAGKYTVTFTVMNENGQSAKSTITVNVGNQNVITPVPMPTVPTDTMNKDLRLKQLYNQLLEIIKQIIELQNGTN